MILVAFGWSHLALRCLPRTGGKRPRIVRVLTGHLVHIFSLARPLLSALRRLFRFQAHPLDRWRRFSRADLAELRTLAGLVWLSECELGRPFSHVVSCSDATLRRYCVQCTTATFEELKKATCFREPWRSRTREIPHTFPVRRADGVVRLGALSPLGGHSCDNPEEQDGSCLSGTSAYLQVSKGSRLGMVIGSTVKACAPAGLLCELPALKQRRLKSVWEPPVVSLQHGATPPAGTPMTQFQVSGGNSHEGRSCHSHGSSPCFRGNVWARSPLPEPHGQHEQPICLRSRSLR